MVLGLGKKKLDLDSGDLGGRLMKALESVSYAPWKKNVVELGMIDKLTGEKGRLDIDVVLPTYALALRDDLEAAIKHAAAGVLDDGTEVRLHVTQNVKSAVGGAFNKEALPGIKNVVLVASGKGGVGKSTVAANLATALSKLGCNVGLLDADMYGPSVPTMFGIPDGARPGAVPGDNPERPKMVPLERFGIKLMSIGFLVDTSTPMVWRGPMIASAAMQLFKDVAWGDIDYLVVDMPPGTGDIQLTISQQVVVSGAVVVSTPQDVALADVIRAKHMFDKVNIPSLGIVENMSYFICDSCDKRHEIFTHGGAKEAAKNLDMAFLGEIPIETNVRAGGDEGAPVVLRDAESGAAQAFVDLAQKTATRLAQIALDAPKTSSGPSISISGGLSAAKKKKPGLPIIN